MRLKNFFLEWWISKRYLKPKGKEGFFSVITLVSFLGIASGVAVLVVVMSVMNGFRTELINKIVGLNGHILIHPLDNEGIKDVESINEILNSIDGVEKTVPMIESQLLAMGESQSLGVLIRGISSKDIDKIDIISSNIILGDKNNLANGQVIIGSRLASSLSLSLGSNMTLISPRGISSPFGTIPRSYSYDVGAIFEIGMTDYDSSIVFQDIETLRQLLNLGDVVGVIEIFVDNPDNSLYYKDLIDNELIDYRVFSRDWRETNSTLKQVLTVERNVMFLILSLILVIAGLNIISGLIILVKDRSREISILRAMGMRKISIARIFVYTGAKIGIFATFTGLLIGILFSIYIDEIRLAISSILNVTLFSPEVYFLIQMPSEIQISEVITIAIMSLSLSIISTIYPAYRSISKDPAEALRNE
ncbi:MAG: lipoprotein-releasing ABC transporter permease subunit [Pseudomonadota bacterium]|nr:lipoprotein-releasing ABC transporter permease subunit [Pseudomonadota bacterium]